MSKGIGIQGIGIIPILWMCRIPTAAGGMDFDFDVWVTDQIWLEQHVQTGNFDTWITDQIWLDAMIR